jgi:phage gpG-like protein
MTQISWQMKAETERRFDAETTPEGRRWHANHPIYKKLCKPPNARILVRSGKLRASFIRSYGTTGRRHYAMVGNTVKYGIYHMFGYTTHNLYIPGWGGNKGMFFKKLTVKPRRFIGISNTEVTRYVRYIARYLTR